MDFRNLVVGFVFLVAGSANASTIFAPTDGNVNFLNTNIDFTGGLTQVAMFNVGALGGSEMAVVLDSTHLSSIAEFTLSAPNTSVDVKPNASGTAFDSMTLFGSDNFILGITTDNGINWASDIGVTAKGADTYDIHFDDGSILTVDVRVVPVPAAVWLFGSGLLGLAGIARRKN